MTVPRNQENTNSVNLAHFPAKYDRSDGMPKISDIPPELLDHIVLHGSNHGLDHRARYREMKSFSLVDPAFRSASQRLLNQRLKFNFDTNARLWLENRWEGRVKELSLWVGERENGRLASGVTGETALEIIRACGSDSLEKLELLGSRVDYKILEEPNLKSEFDLHKRGIPLTVRCTDVRSLYFSGEVDPAAVASVVGRFIPSCAKLESLTFLPRGLQAMMLIARILKVITGSLQTLRVRETDIWTMTVITATLMLRGRRLKTIELTLHEPNDLALEERIFEDTSSLESLDLGNFTLVQMSKAIANLPKPTLTHLRMQIDGVDFSIADSPSFQQVEEILVLPSLKNLKRLELGRGDPSTWTNEEEMHREEAVVDAWIVVWKKKGLEISYLRRL